MQQLDTDVLVVGRGISGLMAAWRAAKGGQRVLVVGLGGGGSGWLQGCNVALGHADPNDSVDAHVDDILKEGCGLNDPGLVRDTVENAVLGFYELVELGVPFARDGDRFLQRRASGSRFARSCFVERVMWGPESSGILQTALKSRDVAIERLRLVRLVEIEGGVVGAIAFVPSTGEVVAIRCKATILASGGVGALYSHSTYPSDVNGSSYAIGFYAGASLVDMEFIQFEPLVGRNPPPLRGYAFPTTLFADGAVLRDRSGNRFLDRDGRNERSIGKEEMVREMAALSERNATIDGSGVWFDLTALSEADVRKYKWLDQIFTKHRIDFTKSLIDIWPAAHSCLGGLVVDRKRQTSVQGLFAVGEAAAGMHGAGHLAAGSGTDVLGSGYIGGDAAAAYAKQRDPLPWPGIIRAASKMLSLESLTASDSGTYSDIVDHAEEILSRTAGLNRTGPELQKGLNELKQLYDDIAADEPLHPASARLALLDRILISGMILNGALRRQESRGAHLRKDYPQRSSAFDRNTPVTWCRESPFVDA